MATVLVVFVALHGGRLGRWQLLKEEFSEAAFPAKAVDHLMAEGVHDRLFSTDAWSGYLLYRMAPGFQVMVDDRFDFYGEEYMLQYASTVAGAPQWSKMLNEYHANRALLPPGFALTTLLRQSSEWKVDYEDTQAVLFCRADGCAK